MSQLTYHLETSMFLLSYGTGKLEISLLPRPASSSINTVPNHFSLENHAGSKSQTQAIFYCLIILISVSLSLYQHRSSTGISHKYSYRPALLQISEPEHLSDHSFSNSWSLADTLWISRALLNFQGWDFSLIPTFSNAPAFAGGTDMAGLSTGNPTKVSPGFIASSFPLLCITLSLYCLEINTNLKGKEKRSWSSF